MTPRSRVVLFGIAAALAAARARAQSPPTLRPPTTDPVYRIAVAAEARDEITFITFDGKTAHVERTQSVGVNPMEPDGPHGIAAAPDGKSYYVTTAHGTPFGYLWKFDAANGASRGRVELGNFPATVQVSPDGAFAFVVNFNLHGEMVPSSVSVVSTDPFVEIARVRTCVMPHGSRLSPDGSKHYSACMMDDHLVEIDTRTLSVARHFMLEKGKEHGSSGAPDAHAAAGAADHSGHGAVQLAAGSTKCSPTWAQPSADGKRVFVACNAANDIAEVDVATWALTRRIPAGNGVYNLAVTHDGTRIVATNKRGQSVSVIDIATGRVLATIATQRRVVHGVVIPNDDRFAFISVEGVGSEPGTVEIIDLRTYARVASVDVGQMAGGIELIGGGR